MCFPNLALEPFLKSESPAPSTLWPSLLLELVPLDPLLTSQGYVEASGGRGLTSIAQRQDEAVP